MEDTVAMDVVHADIASGGPGGAARATAGHLTHCGDDNDNGHQFLLSEQQQQSTNQRTLHHAESADQSL
jgi:hypothetical protein